MTAEQILKAFAGFMVLITLFLTYFVHPNFIWLTVFVGANLLQSAFTGFCPAMMVIKKLGFKTEIEVYIQNSCINTGEKNED